jgi:putative hydrolase
MIIHSDLHTHTVYSHGKGSVQDNVLSAGKKGLKGIAITDHGPANLFGVGVRLDVFPRIKEDIIQAKKLWTGGTILFGVEANVLNRQGLLDVPPECLGEFDILLAGLHLLTKPLSFRKIDRFIRSKLGIRLKESADQLVYYTDALIAAVYSYPIDIITHPGYRLPVDTKALARACAERGTALEINTAHDHITEEYLRIAQKQGAKFVISSDAHHPDRVGDFDQGIKLALSAGLTAQDILNAYCD